MAKVRPLSAELQKNAIEQLNEVPERVPADIEALRSWINQQPHLNARTDDQYLLTFLRGSKFSLEKAKSKIDKFYTLRTKYPDMFACYDVDEPKFREILNMGMLYHLPTPLNENGPRIMVMRGGLTDPNIHTVEDFMRVACAMQEITMLEDDYAIVNGIIFISDMLKITAAHFFQMSPAVMKKMSVFSEEAVPFRPKAQHFFNTPAGFEPVFNTFKSFMSKKLQNRIFVHGNKLDLMQKEIPKKYLPIEYGGENGSIEDSIVFWTEKMDQYRDYFKENRNFVTNEKLRIGKPIDFENLFGIEGTFRKLDVD